jgi:hypothetical protein
MMGNQIKNNTRIKLFQLQTITQNTPQSSSDFNINQF